MKYTIYKTNVNLNNKRWWRNYDLNHKDLPDIDIETYLTNNSISWVELKNSRNEPIKYETISRDNIDEIELYLSDWKDVPDYIKITFNLANGVNESAYYFIKNTPMFYNSVNKLACQVKYTLDKYASFMFKFHNHLKTITVNPNMFFVRKHHDRQFIPPNPYSTDMRGIDFILQPWLQDKTDNISGNLVVKESKTLNWDKCPDAVVNNYLALFFKYESKILNWSTSLSGPWNNYHTCTVITNDNPSETGPASVDLILDDTIFRRRNGVAGYSNFFDYIVVKPNGYERHNGKFTNLTGFLLFPIKWASSSSADQLGNLNTPELLSLNLPDIFSVDNIIGRFTSPLSPATIALMYGNKNSFTGIGNLYAFDKTRSNDYTFGAILVDGTSHSININKNLNSKFLKDIKNLFTTRDHRKTKENNPHLFSPAYWQLVYCSTTNDKSTLTADYLKLYLQQNPPRIEVQSDVIFMDFFISSDWVSRFNKADWEKNPNMIWSRNGNEFLVSETKNAPIQCSAWANTYQQRQQLDMGRNVMYKEAIFNTIATPFNFIGKAVDAIGSGKGVGASAYTGSLLGLGKQMLNTFNGEAQIDLNRTQLLSQGNSYNAPVGISGLTCDNWGEAGIRTYTMGLTDQEQDIVNSDDNKFGYRVRMWLPYSDYLNCWHGNYMLCDISKNYNALFSELKNINSIFTKDDNYINEFLNILNNGVTWYVDGVYRNLATDEYNWERYLEAPTE